MLHSHFTMLFRSVISVIKLHKILELFLPNVNFQREVVTGIWRHRDSPWSTSPWSCHRDSWICRTRKWRTGKWRTGKWRSRTRANVYTTYCTRWSEHKLMCTTRNYFTHKSEYISYGYCLRDLEQQCDRQHKLQHWDTRRTVVMVIVWFLFYHIFNKYNFKCGIIYVFRLMLETITCRTH